MAVNLQSLGIKSSSAPISTNKKIMLWGATGTRKTESVLRNFPNVLVLDSEGNAKQCVGMKEIPEFLYSETKDVKKALEIMELVAQGKITMPNGQPIQTLCFDSASVFWSTQQEVASSLAERRASKWNKPVDEATTTQIDWVVAKRPMKRINIAMNGTSIKYLILIAREKDLYVDDPAKKDQQKKVGFTYDVMKNTDFEMNLTMRLGFEDLGMGKSGEWFCEVTKVQGLMGETFPKGKRFKTFPFQQIAEVAGSMTVEPVKAESEDEIGLRTAIAETEKSEPHTQAELLRIAKENGIEPAKLGALLKGSEIGGFVPARWDEMKQLIRDNAMAVAGD
jgi:hypothetical protein